MSDRDTWERILVALYDATLDDSHWPATSALIDDACSLTGNGILVGKSPRAEVQTQFVGLYYHGQRRKDLEREYLEVYHPIDELVPRIRRLPDSRLVHIPDLYTADELKTSPVYNEALRRGKSQDGLIVRVGGAYGTHMTWGIADPIGSEGWGSWQIAMITRLVPHIRQFFHLRQALVRARTRSMTETTLFDNPRVGVLHLDRRGRILAVNDRARRILGYGGALSDREGELRARAPDDQPRLERLFAAALPTSDTVAVSGSISLRRSWPLPPLVVHVHPVRAPQPHYGVRYVAALVLIVEPERRHRIDAGLIATTLGLTPGQSQVAAWLAEGRSVAEMARDTGRTRGAIYWHLKEIYQKLHISRQAELVRLVLSIADLE